MSENTNKQNDRKQNGISESDKKKAQERSSINAAVIHEIIREEGQSELERPSTALLWSGLAAGLSMSFSMVSEGLIFQYLSGLSWAHLLSKLGYTIGFLIVVIGQQQLYTENTLTAVLPVLHDRKLKAFLNMLRLWGIVLAANLIGVFIVSSVIAVSDVFSPEAKTAFLEIGQDAMRFGFGTTLLKGIFAGWLIALMVWMLPGAELGKIWIVIIITYIVGLGGLTHIIAGSSETFYLVASGSISFAEYLLNYMIPTLIGNTIGGVSLVAALNHAQVVAGSRQG